MQSEEAAPVTSRGWERNTPLDSTGASDDETSRIELCLHSCELPRERNQAENQPGGQEYGHAALGSRATTYCSWEVILS